MPKPAIGMPSDTETPQLAISPEKVCFIVIKGREFAAKEEVVEPDPGSNATDDGMIGVLEDYGDDPVVEEITSFIGAMTVDEQVDLVALMWLGRGDGGIEDWEQLRDEAARAHGEHPRHTAAYLLGTPLASDYLEEALSLFGKSCEPDEVGRL